MVCKTQFQLNGNSYILIDRANFLHHQCDAKLKSSTNWCGDGESSEVEINSPRSAEIDDFIVTSPIA